MRVGLLLAGEIRYSAAVSILSGKQKRVCKTNFQESLEMGINQIKRLISENCWVPNTACSVG